MLARLSTTSARKYAIYCLTSTISSCVCSKQVKCPVVVANEMSGLAVRAGVESRHERRVSDGAISSADSGAGVKDTGSDIEDDSGQILWMHAAEILGI
jgi:hypothetical protein